MTSLFPIAMHMPLAIAAYIALRKGSWPWLPFALGYAAMIMEYSVRTLGFSVLYSLLILGALVGPLRNRRSLLLPAASIPYIALLSVLILAALLPVLVDAQSPLVHLRWPATLFLVAIAIMLQKPTLKAHRSLLLGIACAGVAIAALLVLQRYFSEDIWGLVELRPRVHRLSAFFWNPNTTALHLLTAYCAYIGLAASPRGGVKLGTPGRLLALVFATGLSLFCISLTGSRAGMVAFVLVAAYTLLRMASVPSRIATVIQWSSLAAFIVITQVFMPNLGTDVERGFAESRDRQQLAVLAIEQHTETGFLGAPREIADGALINYHNDFLQYLADYGVPALVVWIALILWIYISAHKPPSDRTETTALMIAFPPICAVYIVFGFLHGMMRTTPLFWIVCSFLFLSSPSQESIEVRSTVTSERAHAH